MSKYTVTSSIIHKCYAIKVPQTKGGKLSGIAQIVPCYSLTHHECEELVGHMNSGCASNGYWIDRLTNYGERFISQLRNELKSMRLEASND